MNFGLFVHFDGLRLRERLEYRSAYLLGMTAQMLGYSAEYLLIYLLLRQFPSINGWTWPEVAFLFSLDLFSYAVGASFVYSPMIELEEMIVQGNFETILARPLDPLLHLCARKYNVGYLAHVLLAGAFLIWSIGRLGTAWSPVSVVYLVLAIFGASCLQAAVLIAVGSLTFWIVRSDVAFTLLFNLKSFLSYPLTLYGVGIQWLLTLVVPLAFVNFYPASLLLGKDGAILPASVGWLAPIVGIAAVLLTYRLFRAGVSAYQGAGG
jgi:ABC-2 type transport system permease protein